MTSEAEIRERLKRGMQDMVTALENGTATYDVLDETRALLTSLKAELFELRFDAGLRVLSAKHRRV